MLPTRVYCVTFYILFSILYQKCNSINLNYPNSNTRVFKSEQSAEKPNGFDRNLRNMVSKCGYQSCNAVNEGMINVHLVPHTHDDVGWLKNVDEYYYGSKKLINPAGVQYILDSVIPELEKNPSRRFIYVEIAFFKRWWDEQSNAMKQRVTTLVNAGRLEFILGGWCMVDEAATHYNAIIDQHTLGFDFLKSSFGECGRPRVAWQIDPFGHSKELASLFAQLGYDGLFFGRLDYQDKLHRMAGKTMETVWEASQDLGTSSNLLTGALFNGYGPPNGFCFDEYCADPPIMDDPLFEENNVNERVGVFLKAVKVQAQSYATSHLIMTMGSDFQYSNANMWYKNLDKLIHYINAKQVNGSKVNLLYSTPSCYLYQLYLTNRTWTGKQDDYFPYADSPHTFWTGYFTSRPTLKDYDRRGNNILQICKQANALSFLNDFKQVNILKETLAVNQHHDAVTGTEKQAVAYDYAQRLARGMNACQGVISNSFGKIIKKSSKSPQLPPLEFCTLLNISACTTSESSKQFALVLYKPVAHVSYVDNWIRIPVVANATYTISDFNGNDVPYQVVPVPDWIKSIPERISKSNFELVFNATIYPMGFNVYFIKNNSGHKETKKNPAEKSHSRELPIINNDIYIKNEYLLLVFDSQSGLLKQIQNLESEISLDVTQKFYYYIAHPANKTGTVTEQASGAYIFRPLYQVPEPFVGPVKIQVIQGPLVQEVWQTFSGWVHQVVRLYKGARNAEFDWTVGPVPIIDGFGKEVITRFESGLQNNKTYYTDSNGRQILKRILNYRPTWPLKQTEPVAGNYYPVDSRIFIQDEAKGIQMTVMTDRAQGGASINDGQIELMVHRRLLYDDAKGVNEPLNETGSDGNGLIVTGKHYLIIDDIAKSVYQHRELALQLYMNPIVSFVPGFTYESWSPLYFTMGSVLARILPPNVHMLTLEERADNSWLMRFEHMYQKNEDPVLSKPANVTLQGLFIGRYQIESVQELTLGGNLNITDLHRLQFKVASNVGVHDPATSVLSTTTGYTFTLYPMQIRTFQVQVKLME